VSLGLLVRLALRVILALLVLLVPLGHRVRLQP
jgi:hypothetical protein